MLCEMQSVSSRIWTRVTVFISNDDNRYTTGTSVDMVTQVIAQSQWKENWKKQMKIGRLHYLIYFFHCLSYFSSLKITL